MLTVIVFDTEQKANDLLKEIGSTPAFENGEEPVSVWDWEEDKPLAYVHGADGRVAITYPFGELARVWLTAYLQGLAQVLNELPTGWQHVGES